MTRYIVAILSTLFVVSKAYPDDCYIIAGLMTREKDPQPAFADRRARAQASPICEISCNANGDTCAQVLGPLFGDIYRFESSEFCDPNSRQVLRYYCGHQQPPKPPGPDPNRAPADTYLNYLPSRGKKFLPVQIKGKEQHALHVSKRAKSKSKGKKSPNKGFVLEEGPTDGLIEMMPGHLRFIYYGRNDWDSAVPTGKGNKWRKAGTRSDAYIIELLRDHIVMKKGAPSYKGGAMQWVITHPKSKLHQKHPEFFGLKQKPLTEANLAKHTRELSGATLPSESSETSTKSSKTDHSLEPSESGSSKSGKKAYGEYYDVLDQLDGNGHYDEYSSYLMNNKEGDDYNQLLWYLGTFASMMMCLMTMCCLMVISYICGLFTHSIVTFVGKNQHEETREDDICDESCV